MTIKLFGHPWSINTRKTLATVAEKGHALPMSLVMLPTGEHKRPEHLRVHPFGKVPVLDDRGFVLYETRAINSYLDATLDGRALVPRDARDRARMDHWRGDKALADCRYDQLEVTPAFELAESFGT